MATVGDVLREVLPSGTVCLAGHRCAPAPRGAIAVRGRVESNELPIARRLAQRWSCVLLELPDSNEGAVSLVEAKVTTYLTSGHAAVPGGMGDVPAEGGDK